MITLYLETDFLIGFAKNQDQESTKLVKIIQDLVGAGSPISLITTDNLNKPAPTQPITAKNYPR